MYDVKGEPHEFVGERREEVIAKACEFFGVDQDTLEIAEFPPGEIYGLGGRCLIVAGVRGAQTAARSSERSERRGAPPGERPRGESERPGRGGRGERGGRPGRGGRGERGGRGDRNDHPGRGERLAPAVAEPSEPSIGTASGELGEVGAFVLGLIERMDLGPFEISENEEDNLLIFEIRGAAAAELARGAGRSVDAIQLLANQAAMRGSDEAPRVVVDVEGNDEARESLLSRLAERVARRARDSGRAVAVDPMNGRDRRLIHLALRDEEGIATMSIGEGRYRQVVVVPEGAPEYEDARREAEAARTGS